MRRWIVIVGLLISTCSVAAQTHFGRVMAAAPYSEAKDFISLLASGSFGRAAQMVTSDRQVDYPAEGLEAGWMALLEKFGRFQAQEVSGADISGDQWTIHVICTFDRGRVDVALGFSSTTDQGKVTGVSYSKLMGNERL